MILDNKQDVDSNVCSISLSTIISTDGLIFLPKSYVPFKVPTQFWTEFSIFVDVDWLWPDQQEFIVVVSSG